MPFIDVEFTNNTTLPASDLDQLSENLEVVREESNYYPILTASCKYITDGRENFAGSILIDGVEKAASITSTIFEQGDISLSLVSVGIHTITFRVDSEDDESGSAELEEFDFQFYRSPEMEYMSVWVGPHGVVTVIGHRVIKSWI